MFLMATLVDGSQVVSEFTELSKVQKYVLNVFNGKDAFNAWKVIDRVHPISGEAVLIRERTLISGRSIVKIEQVHPTIQDHGYSPGAFRPYRVTKAGEKGLWKVPVGTTVEQDGVLAHPDADYPLHQDGRSLRNYVILRVANEGEGVTEVRYFVDGREAPTTVTPSRSEDDDLDPDDDGYDGFDDDEHVGDD